MRWYKILAQILLILSVIGFAPAAPVVVQEHDVRVSGVDAANDETAPSRLRRDPWQANSSAADRTNAPLIPRSSARSSDSGHWREQQEPRQHKPRSRTNSNYPPEPSNPAPPIDLTDDTPPSPSLPPARPGSTSPSLTSQAPTVEPDPLNPSSSPHGNTDLNPSPYQGQGLTDDSHALNPALVTVSDSRPLRADNLGSRPFPELTVPKSKSLSELMMTPTHATPPPDGSPQIASSSDESYSSSSWVPTDSHSDSTSSWSSQDHVPSPPSSEYESFSELTAAPSPDTPRPDGSLQMASSPDESHSSSSWSSQDHASPPASSPGLSQDRAHSPSHSKFKSLSELMAAPTPGRPDTPRPDGFLQMASSPDESHSSSSWSSQDHVSPPLAASSPGSSQDRVHSPSHSKFKSFSELVSAPTHDTPPPQMSSSSDGSYTSSSWAPTDSYPGSTSSWSSQDHVSPPASSMDQLSTDKPNPPPNTKRPRPEEHGFEKFFSKLPKGKFERRVASVHH